MGSNQIDMSIEPSPPKTTRSRLDNNRTSVATAGDATRRITCGGLAGMIAKTATAPLERMKMLSQTGEHGGSGVGGKPQSVMSLFRNIIHHEGVIGLWAGNGTNLLRIFPAKGVVFASNDFYRTGLHRLVAPAGVDVSETTPPGYVSFCAGGLSGMSASAATYPMDLARGRITGKLKVKVANRSGTSQELKLAEPRNATAYRGLFSTIAVTVRDEGFLALYKGVTPTLLGAVPYEGIKFGTVGTMELFFPFEASEDQKRAPIWRKVCFGGLGGVMSGLITYPNDTVRRMLQLQGSRGTTETYSGYWDCVKKTYAMHGMRRFYYGVGINLVRMAPNTAVQFGSYEVLKRMSDGFI